MLSKLKILCLSFIENPGPKALLILTFLLGIVLFNVYLLHRMFGHVKQAKIEYEALKKRGVLRDSYFRAFDAGNFYMLNERPVYKDAVKRPDTKSEVVYPKVHIDKEKPIQLDISEYETTILDTSDKDLNVSEGNDDSAEFETTLL